MKKISLFLSFILLSSFFVQGKTFALSCAEPPSFEKAYLDYDVVVAGTVTDVKESSSSKIVTVETKKSFKGNEEDAFSFKEDITWGDSQIGTEYLLFLNKEGGSLVSPLCSPTSETISINLDELVFDDTPKETVIEEETVPTNPEDEILSIQITSVESPNESDDSDESESFDPMIILAILSVLITATVVAIILYQTRKK